MITISTPVYPTEGPSKILKALEKAFPACKFTVAKNKIYCAHAKLESLVFIKQKVEDKRIANTIRYLVLEHHKLELNKQALIKEKINFVEETYPLGNVVIEFGDEKEVLDYLAPSTI